MAADNEQKLEQISALLEDIVKDLIEESETLNLTEKPNRIKKSINEYDGKLRVGGLDVFNEATIISTISFYPTEKDKEEHNALGAIVLYLKQAEAENVLRPLGYKKVETDELETINEAVVEISTKIADKFVEKLSSQGYGKLVYSEPVAYHNVVSFGVDFSIDQFDLFQSVFNIKKVDSFAFDVTMKTQKK